MNLIQVVNLNSQAGPQVLLFITWNNILHF